MLIGQAFARIEAGSTIGALDDDIRVVPGCRFEDGINAVCADDIDGRQSVTTLLAGLDQGEIVITCDNARGQNSVRARRIRVCRGHKDLMSLITDRHAYFIAICDGNA